MKNFAKFMIFIGYKHNDIRKGNKKRKKLREPLVIGEKVFVLAERLKKTRLTGTRYFLLEELLLLTILIITEFQKQLMEK